MKISIHPATVNDAKEIAILSSQLGYSSNTTDIVLRLKNVLDHADHYVCVAKKDGNIVGWIHGFKAYRIESNAFAEIGGLVVDQSHQNMGIGTLLLKHFQQWSLKSNLRKIRVRCNNKRLEAHRFYNKNGYTMNKEQKIFDFSFS